MKIIVCAALVLVALLGTFALRRYALLRNMLDTPNARSSHSVPTPRGGGVAIVSSFLLALSAWFVWCGVPVRLFWALVPGAALVAALGFWDDHAPLPAKVRLFFHVLAAIWAVLWLGGWAVLDLGFASLPWGWLGGVLAVLGLAWSINLYNFMDGIDGLAGSQAVFVGAAGGTLLMLLGYENMHWFLLAAAALGFLLLNWPPARIFMGDAGSGFLGYAIGVMALHAIVSGQTSIWPWLILMGVFLVDATLTLLRRAGRGARVMDAHRTHAYQWASRQCGAHRPVTVSVMLINVGILWPAALASVAWPRWALLITVLCFGGLAFLAWRFKAGVPETLETNVRK